MIVEKYYGTKYFPSNSLIKSTKNVSFSLGYKELIPLC